MSHLIRFLLSQRRNGMREETCLCGISCTTPPFPKINIKHKLSITDTLYWLGQWFKQVFSNRLKESWLEFSDQMIFQSDFKLRCSLWIGEVTALIISQEMDFTNIAKHSFEKMRLKRWSFYRPYVHSFILPWTARTYSRVRPCFPTWMQDTINTYSLPTSWNSSQQEKDNQRKLYCASNSQSWNV